MAGPLPESGDHRTPFVRGPSSREALDDKRAQIVRSAAELFFENGYARTSMAAVATRAGGSKATLYNYFPSKDALFGAVIEASAPVFDWLDDVLGVPDQTATQVLMEVGRAFYRSFARREALALFRVVLAEGPHFPEIREIFWKDFAEATFATFSDYLVKAAARGEIHVSNPQVATRQFFALVRGDLHLRMVAGVVESPSQAEIETFLQENIGLFIEQFVITEKA